MKRIFGYLLIGCFYIINAWGVEEQRAVRSVTFNTSDKGSVDALIYGNGKHAVVLAHGAIFNKESWETFAKALAAKGFTALALDFRGYGQSKPGIKPNALYEDILAAIRYLRRDGAAEVSVVGASMGGGAVGEAAINAEPGEIDKLVLLSPVSIAHPERLKGEILFVASRDESMLGGIKTMFEKAPEPKKFLLLEGRAHAQHIFKTDQSEKLTSELIRFLTEVRANDSVLTHIILSGSRSPLS